MRWLIFIFLITGCSSQIPFEGKKIEHNQALQVLEKSLRQQHAKYMPDQIEITDKYFKTEKTSLRRNIATMEKVSVGEVKYVYFDRLGDPGLYEKGGLYVVLVKDKSGGTLYNFGTAYKDVAEDFYSAIASLSRTF